MNVTTGSFGAPAVSDGAPNFSRPLYSSLKYSSSFANPSGVSTAFSSSYGGASVSHQTRGLYGSSLRPSSVTYTAKLSNTSVGDVAPFSKFSGISGVAPVYSSTYSKSLLPSTFRTSSFSSHSVANRVPPSANPPSNQGTHRYHLLEMCFNACIMRTFLIFKLGRARAFRPCWRSSFSPRINCSWLPLHLS